MLWDRRLPEYFSALNAGRKWRKPEQNFKLNNSIIHHTDNTTRSFRPQGHVLERLSGKDEIVRLTKLNIRKSTVILPANKISLLEENY